MKILGEQCITNWFDVSEEFKGVVGLSQKHEEGTNNCGLFAIVAIITLTFRNFSSQVILVENEMQNHF